MVYLDCKSQKVMKYESKGSGIRPFVVNIVTAKERTCINTNSLTHTDNYFSVVSRVETSPY